MLHGKGAAERNQLTKVWYLSFGKTCYIELQYIAFILLKKRAWFTAHGSN